MDKKWWYVVTSNSINSTVDLNKFYGTAAELKQCLVFMATESFDAEVTESDVKEIGSPERVFQLTYKGMSTKKFYYYYTAYAEDRIDEV